MSFQKLNELSLKAYFKVGSFILLPVAAVLSSSQAFAQSTPVIPWNPTNIGDFGTLVNIVINFVTAFVGVLAVLYLILSGFNYVMAGGNAKKVAAAKAGITNAVIGVAVVVISYIIVRLVLVDLLNVKQSSFWKN
ncbi:MAG: hypothetical protein WCP97_05510 [bacterium]